MSILQSKFEEFKSKLLQSIQSKFPNGDINIQYDQGTAINGMGMVNGIDVLIQIDNEADKYFVAEDQQGAYFQRFWNGKL